jgi:hypothetical protein
VVILFFPSMGEIIIIKSAISLIVLSMLLCLLGTAQNESSDYEPVELATELEGFNFETYSMAEVGDPFGYYGYDSFGYEAAAEPLTLAFMVPDLDGDSGSDILAENITTDPETGAISSEIFALSGKDGSLLWRTEYPGALAYAASAGDLNGDGQNDVVVNVVLSSSSFIPYSSVAALNGESGTEIWSRSEMLAATFAYPLQDLNGDSATDLVVHLFGIDSLNNSLVTKISTVDGARGSDLESRIFAKSLAIEYPAGNLTSDQVQDSIRCIYHLADTPENTTTTVAAVNGSNRSDLWATSFDGSLALAVPCPDLSGDGTDDLLAYLLSFEGGVGSLKLALIQGNDGEVLWMRDYGNNLALAFVGSDLSGEGLPDLMVYKIGTGYEDDEEVEAVKGDDGALLWSRTSTLLLPS